MKCDNASKKENVKLIFDTLEFAKYDETYAFDSFLDKLGMAENDNILQFNVV